MNEEEVLSNLGGYITSSKDFRRNKKIDQDGIFSEKVFGPLQSYNCSCGNYNTKVLHADKVCPKCGVICGSNELRSSVFGKIKMIFPIVKPSKFNSFLKILGNENKQILDPVRADLTRVKTNYIAFKTDFKNIKIVKKLKMEKNYIVIPFRITGIYSLYLVLKFLKQNFNISVVNEIFENNYLTHEMRVLPPNLRLLTVDPVKNVIMCPEVNKYYQSILKLNEQNSPLASNLDIDETDWLDTIRISLKEKIFDQEIMNPTVIEYDSTTAKYQYWVNEIYDFVYEQLSGKEGLIRSSILGKNIEFSARTVVTIDPSIPPYKIKVSKKILRKLWAPYFLYYLTSIRGFDYEFCFEDLMLYENINPKFDDLFDEFLNWFCDKNNQELIDAR